MEEFLRTWSGPVATVLSIGAIVYSWLTSKSTKNEVRIDKHDEDLQKLSIRTQDLESEFKHLPSKDDVSDLKLAVVEMKGDLKTIEEAQSGTGRAVRRIEEFLIESKPK